MSFPPRHGLYSRIFQSQSYTHVFDPPRSLLVLDVGTLSPFFLVTQSRCSFSVVLGAYCFLTSALCSRGSLVQLFYT